MTTKVKVIKAMDSVMLGDRINEYLRGDSAKGYKVGDIKYQMMQIDGTHWYSALIIMEEESE